MNDKEKLISLLNEFGVGFNDKGKEIKIKEGMEKVDGYFSLFTIFKLDDNGKFIEMSIWK